MKRLLVILALLCMPAFATKTIESTVAFTDPQGNVLNAGYIVFQLNMGARAIVGGQVVNNTPITVTLTSGGLIPNSTVLFANDELMPTGTYYVVTIYNSSGAIVRGPENWILAGTSPIDLSMETDAVLPDPGLATPVIQNPSSSQTICCQPLTVSGNFTATGNVNATAGQNIFASYNLNNTILIDGNKYPASGSAQTTTGTINASSSSLTLASALDFKNGQGILVVGAGAAPLVSSPNTVTVTPEGAMGSTSYQYQIVAIDAFGGISAPSTVATTSSGNSSLNRTNYNLINLNSGNASNGYAYAIYGRTSGSMQFIGLVGCASNTTCFYRDTGVVEATRPAFIPNSIPSSSQNEFLLTTITSGAGTTSLTLANSATASVSSQLVYHDDSAAVISAINAANALGGATVVFPPGTYYIDAPENTPPGNRAFLYCASCNNLHLMGAGPTSILTSLMPGLTMIELDGGAGQEIEHLQFLMPTGSTGLINQGSNTSGSAIRVVGITNGRIHDNEINGGMSLDIWLTGGTTYTTVFNNYLVNGTYAGINEDNCGSANTYTSCAPTATPKNNMIIANRCVNVGAEGQPNGSPGGDCYSSDMGAAGGDVYLNLSKNYCEWNLTQTQTNKCIGIGTSGHVSVEGNFINGSDGDGIDLTMGGNTGVTVQADSAIGNIVEGVALGGIQILSNPGAGNTLNGFTIRGNTVRNSGEQGIYINADASNVTNVDVSVNTIFGAGTLASNTYDAMSLNGTGVHAVGNLVNGNAISANCLTINTAASNVTGSGNMLTNCATNLLNDASTIANLSGLIVKVTSGNFTTNASTTAAYLQNIDTSSGDVVVQQFGHGSDKFSNFIASLITGATGNQKSDLIFGGRNADNGTPAENFRLPAGGGFEVAENSAPTSVSAKEYCYGDSTAHSLKCAYNGTNFHFSTVVERGTCTMASGTCTFTYAAAFTSTPICTATWNGTGTLTGIVKAVPGTSSVVVTSSVNTDTGVMQVHCDGNPD